MRMMPPTETRRDLPRRPQPVEKVGVGPVGGPREPENKAKTLRKRRIQPLNRGQKRARRGFSTGWSFLGSLIARSRILGRPCARSGARQCPLAHHRYMRLATRLDRYAPNRMVGSQGSSCRFVALVALAH